MKNILVTGASSGLGKYVALQYAGAGVTLGLLGRDPVRLAATARAAEKKGARTHVAAIDLRDGGAMRAFCLDFDHAAPVDGLIASAGISLVTPGAGEVEDLEEASAVFDVNLRGLMNTLSPIAPRMRARRSGRIALFSSLAAFATPPDSPAYAASKAAVLAFGLATRALYKPDGVSVSVVCPGFVDTPMTAAYRSWKPMLLSPDDAAARILRGLNQRKAIIAFPLPLYWAARAQSALPQSLRAALMMQFRAFAQKN